MLWFGIREMLNMFWWLLDKKITWFSEIFIDFLLGALHCLRSGSHIVNKVEEIFFFIEFTVFRGPQIIRWQKVLISAMVENLVKFISMDNDSCHLLTIYHIPGTFLTTSLKLFPLNQYSISIKQNLFLPSLFYRMEQKEKSLAQRIIVSK